MAPWLAGAAQRPVRRGTAGHALLACVGAVIAGSALLVAHRGPESGAAAFAGVAPRSLGLAPGVGMRAQTDVALQAVPVAPKLKLASLTVGQKFKGSVVFLTHGGAFVDIGAETCGLLHSSTLNYAMPVKEGQELDVYVAAVNLGHRKFALELHRKQSWPRVMPRPRDVESFKGVSPSEWLEGKLVGVEPIGAFIELPAPNSGAPIEGFLHVSEMKGDFPRGAKLGQTVSVRVLKVDEADRRLKLSMKDLP